MTLEKILYHAFHNGSFTMQSRDYVGGTALAIDEALKHKFLVWDTNKLYQEYKDSGSIEYYDDAFHSYRITKKGEVRLSIYRLHYAVKQSMQDKIQRRGEEYLHLLQESGLSYAIDFDSIITKAERKSIKKFLELFSTTPLLPVVNEPTLLDEDEEDEIGLSTFFKFSTALGPKGTDASRSNDYVFKKCMEELGEMALEDQIANGLSYKDAGSDGVKGEAVDLAICALDMFVLQCNPNMSPEEIEREFLTYMVIKLNKWKKSIGWVNE